MSDHTDQSTGLTRRDALRRAGVVGGAAGVVWATPALTTLSGAAFAAGTPAGNRFDLVDEFNGRNNPTPDFSFRYGGSLLSLQSSAFGTTGLPDLEGGADATSGSTYPFVAKNTSGSTVSAPPGAPGVVVPAGAVFVHPSNDAASPLVIRFTAPAAGTYTAFGSLQSIDSGPGNGVAYVFGGSAGVVPPDGSTVLLSDRFTLQSGQSVELQISSNGSYSYDSTQITLTFTRP